MKRQVWAFHGAIGAGIMGIAAVIGSSPWWAGGSAVLTVVAWKTARAWQRQDPAPMPYSMRWVLSLPRGHSPQRLKTILDPQPGERILEVGPGTGIHAVPVAAALLPDGVVDVLDIEQDMLENLMQRAQRRGVGNILPTLGDAQSLPYPDHAFAAAYLITTLGEIPDQSAALRELQRVIKPGGRLVIGEVIIDPDFLSLAVLKTGLSDAGFDLECVTGCTWSYFALFRRRGG